MIYVKTHSGQQVLKERRGALTPRQRSAFILFDGKRTLAQVLEATAALGITEQDVRSMVEQGVLEPIYSHPSMGTTTVEGPHSVPAESSRTPSDRYQDAYLIATQLTAGLGLRGLPLNLAVEAAGGFKELLALAPKIRAAVGDAKFARLDQVLQG